MIFLRELRRYWWFLKEVYPKEWAHYQQEMERCARHYPGRFRRWEAIRFFPAWQHSIDTKRHTFLRRCPWTAYTLGRLWPAWRCRFERPRNPLVDQCPWLSFAAIRFLKQIVQRSMRVYEYGTGGSTLFFARHVHEVISIEHNSTWFATVQQSLQRQRHTNSQIRLIEPQPLSQRAEAVDPADPYAYRSSNEKFRNCSFEAYAASIDEYPLASFDLVLIDGRARPSCFLHALPRVKPGGYIIWDNTDRAHYAAAMHLAPAHFPFLDFPGPTPYVRSFTRTSVWQRTV